MSKRPRERSSELLDVRLLDGDSVEPITNDLATFLAPLTRDEFVTSVYRTKALVVKVHPRHRSQRLAHIADVLHNFNPVQMLRDSNSEKINVWMGAGKTLHSVKVAAEEAKGCYDAGCGLYFRASEDLEAAFVPAYAEALGHSFGAYFRDGQRRGEIETFATHVGHTTGWHSDFQENFTVQLRGAKRWYFNKAASPHPYRAFAPHFKNTNVLHTQLQMARAGNPAFNGLPSDIDETCESIVLQPGDVLYHPAGIFHKVETIAIGEDASNSLSINVSLFPQSWGHFVAEGTHQLGLTMPCMREALRFDTIEDAHNQIQDRLVLLAKQIAQLKPSMFLPPAALAPTGVVSISSKRVVREDGKLVKSEDALKGPWVRNPLGVLSHTPEALEVPLRQRPSEAEASDEDEEASESDDDDGSVDIPAGCVRFDYHANFVAAEASADVAPAVHCVFVAEADAAALMHKLSGITPGAAVPRSALKSIPGLMTLLLDIGFMA